MQHIFQQAVLDTDGLVFWQQGISSDHPEAFPVVWMSITHLQCTNPSKWNFFLANPTEVAQWIHVKSFHTIQKFGLAMDKRYVSNYYQFLHRNWFIPLIAQVCTMDIYLNDIGKGTEIRHIS